MTEPLPVVIVGCGPVGMMLSLALHSLNVRCVVVEVDAQAQHHPKGSTQNSRTMEHYRRFGIAEPIRRLGLPKDYPTDVAYFTRVGTGWELARLTMPSEREKHEALGRDGVTGQIPEPILRCNQMYVEPLVRTHLATLPSVELMLGWRCVDWTDHGTFVTVEIEQVESGRRISLRTSYLVGCDGGQSSIRRTLGIRYDGRELPAQAFLSGPTVSTHVRIPDFYERVRGNRCWQYWALNPEFRANLVTLDGHGSFIFNTKLAAAGDAVDPASIARQLRAAIGADLELEFIGHWRWTAGQALVADTFGAGRVLLAGDAVHLFTPTGGFGMNTGVDDAVNLGWKLAALTQGWGGSQLLATYERERRPVALRNTNAARTLGGNIGAVPVDGAIEEDSPAGAAARAQLSRALGTFGEEFASIGIQLGVRYDDSPIVISDGATSPADDPSVYVPTSCPGGRTPHFWFDDGRSLFDRLGAGFTLLRLRESADVATLEAGARACRVPVTTLHVFDERVRELYGCDLALIRPDDHIAWRGNEAPADVVALFERVTGW